MSTSRVSGVQPDDGTFQRELFDEIENDLVQRAREVFGPNVDLTQGSPIKQLIDVVIYESDRFWQILEDVYYSAYYEDAYGEQLDKLLSLATIQRLGRRGATGEVTFSVDLANPDDIFIEQGTIVKTRPTDEAPSIPFITTQPVTLPAGAAEIANVPIRAVEPWEYEINRRWLGEATNVPAGSITVFENPTRGLSVTNPHPTGDSNADLGYSYVAGRDRETDAEFRERYEATFGENSAATLTALRTSVLQMENVEAVDIEENVTMVDHTASGGLPPKSFRLTVLHETDRDAIAREITETRPAGIQSYGEVSGESTTQDGVTREEFFDEADWVTIYVTANVLHDSTAPDDVSRAVESAIIEHIGGTTLDADQFNGLEMGQDVYHGLLTQAAMSVRGVYEADVTFGLIAPGEEQETITIGKHEVANTAPSAITVRPTEQERQ